MLFFVRLAKHFFVHALKFRHKSGGTMLLSADSTDRSINQKLKVCVLHLQEKENSGQARALQGVFSDRETAKH